MPIIRALVVLVCAFSVFAATHVELRPVEVAACKTCYGVWADFNGDGLDDLLLHDQLQFNLGGRLAPAITVFALLPDNVDFVTGHADFNRDGFADLIVNGSRLLLGNGTGGFTERALPTEHGQVIQVSDVTNDGRPDLILMNQTTELTIMRGNGDGTFKLHQKLAWGPSRMYLSSGEYDAVGVSDVNGDGRLDLVMPFDNYLYFFFAQPDGTFGAAEPRYTRIDPQPGMSFADVNGDAKADLVFLNAYQRQVSITALFGDGTGRFPGVAHFPVDVNAHSILAGDFVPGGGNEIAYGGDGRVGVLSIVNGRFVEVARTHTGAISTRLMAVRYHSAQPDIVARGQVFRHPLNYVMWLIEAEGAIEETPRSGRTRAIGRGLTVGSGEYDIALESGCAIAGLTRWSFEREGMFLRFAPTPGIEYAEGVVLDGEMFVRMRVKDDATTRVLEGTLTPTATGLTGRLTEWGETPCGGWQIHRVEAVLR